MCFSKRGAHDRTRVEHDLLAIRAVAALWRHNRHDSVPYFQPVGNAAPNLIDDPRRVHSRHIGRRISLLLFGARAAADQDVGRVYSRRMDADSHLSGAGVNFGQIDDLKHFGAAMRE
jgi:hypothetical protein